MTAEAIAKPPGGSRTSGTWMASWPAHDDRERSLSIRGADEKSAGWQSVKDGPFPKLLKLALKRLLGASKTFEPLLNLGR
jgi:hypothetical protein